MASDGLFVGIGVDVHPDPQKRLLHATEEVRELHGLVQGVLDGEPLLNPTEEEVRAHLRDVPE